jgi:O-succinylbenzoic acid--CoA ligase
VPRLVPILASGPAFVDDLVRAWDDGDAVLPLDPRLPPIARDTVLAAARIDDPVDDGDAAVVATSGSSGPAKAVVLTHDALRASAHATSTRLGVDPVTDTWLACIPLAHVGGLSVVTRALITGTKLVVHERFDADAAMAAARDGATLVSLVATALRRIDPAAFRTIVLGGSRPPDILPQNTVTTYGMTETGSGVVYDGRALHGVELEVRDGEIHLRGPMLLRTYRDGRDPKDADGWFATGDLGRIDHGVLTVFGRKGDLIITGGENVWPEPVEAVLSHVANVKDVAITGRPDDEWGQRVVAIVVPVNNTRPPTLEQLRAEVKDHIGPWAAPRAVEYVDTIPRTPLGKVERRALTLSPRDE